MKQTEVTQKEWRTLMGNNPSAHSGCDDCPVEKVTGMTRFITLTSFPLENTSIPVTPSEIVRAS